MGWGEGGGSRSLWLSLSALCQLCPGWGHRMGFGDGKERTQGKEAESLVYVLMIRNNQHLLSVPQLSSNALPDHLYGFLSLPLIGENVQTGGEGVPGSFCLSAFLSVCLPV